MYSFNYNNFALQNTDTINIEEVDGFDGLEIRTSEDFLTGEDGGNIWEQKYAMRTIKIAGSIYTNDISSYFTLRRSLVSAFSLAAGNSLLTITAPDGEVRTIYAKVIDKVSLRESVGEFAEAKFMILLKAGDPFLLDGDIQEVTATLADSGGTPVSSPIPSPLGASTENLLVINNTGDVPYWAKFTFSGEVTNPTITNVSTGEFFRIADTFSVFEGAVIERTTQGLSVEDLSGNNIYADFEGTFFMIALGVNILRFTASTSSASASVTAEFYNRYLTA